MADALDDLGFTLPVLAAPMAGGPGTPALALAAARAGGFGFVAAGYATLETAAAQIAAVRSEGVPFGVNLFAPNPLPVEAPAFRRYARAIQVEADRYGLSLAGAEPVEDDDHWRAKVDLLLTDPVPLVSFTFGIPEPEVVAAFRRAGTVVAQTVTSVEEARSAADAGANVLVVQSSTAGGHWGTLTPAAPPPQVPLTDLVAQIREAVPLPLIAAGGLATPAAVAAAVRAGARAAMVGTVLLLSDESGASATHRTALATASRGAQPEPGCGGGEHPQRGSGGAQPGSPCASDGGTVLTRAFTGRPARGLRNRFIERYGDLAPIGYPALHHLTSPLRKAAAAAGDPELVNLWAGTGYRHATAEPAARILARLASDL
ncbi:nitronate monooxygenase [Rugosimonospora africana]|uniref:Propionate 3-nitronate monooxygenase n=1 Tax=Rugosimonospora africana TaxID=556532 RepID=A0A8J3QNT7_9ACTN|nr:nitronate monooxygenase [Rugosimonospora africana]GIH14373.1 oxidoreductase [Rugosimonospora africana]